MTIQTPISPALDAFGKAVKAERLAREWSLATLADKALGNPDRKGYCSQVEKGQRNLSEGTIRSFARALDLPASVIDPLTGHFLPSEDDTTQSDDAAAALLHEVDALRDKLKLSEALAVAIAYKYADGNPTDIEGALKGLEAALELAAKDQARGREITNYESAAQEIVDRVNDLNENGDIDEAYATLQAEAARRAEALEERKAENGRILKLLITQAALANDAGGYAQAQLQKVQLDSPGAEETFHRLRDDMKDRYEDGPRLGTPFAITSAERLARACIKIAPTRYLCAMAQNDLALTLQNQGSLTNGRKGAALLAEAVEAYRAALGICTELDHPLNWAKTMQNLAIALVNQCILTDGAEGDALLAEAIVTYRAALRVLTEADHPMDWANIMQNLGIALRHQGSRVDGPKGTAILSEAVKAYRVALRVYTEVDHPLKWAKAMQNLGSVLQIQGCRTDGPQGAILLDEAVEAYRATLRVLKEPDTPLYWAMAQQNIATAELSRAIDDTTTAPQPHLDAALAHVDNALRIFDPLHMSHYHTKATTLRTKILDAFDALGEPSSSSSS
ncbi:hypothetical protein [Gymnodinialimonas hymeniacidonis]|uniref:helix-turn-helix domain-containing protein n=1 Tax=Gymnodinialimonas hymeniacidonis TaxID=3126508 RepID=UPI0034C6B1EB